MKKESMSRQTKVFLENLSKEEIQLLDVDNLGKILSTDVNVLDNDLSVDKINEIRLTYAKQILQKDLRTIKKQTMSKVELLSHFGDDMTICDVARVSYNKEASNYSVEQNVKLINYLASHNHWSPFSHPQLQFRLTIPIYVERQLVKTEAGRVYNSLSGRYVDFSDTYTTIEDWRKQSKSSKQGSEGLIENELLASDIENNVIEYCKTAYQKLIDLEVSKEQARTILPLNLNTTMIWTGSLYSFIRICQQRLKPDAQKETRDIVQKMLQCVKNLPENPFEHSLKAYNL